MPGSIQSEPSHSCCLRSGTTPIRLCQARRSAHRLHRILLVAGPASPPSHPRAHGSDGVVRAGIRALVRDLSRARLARPSPRARPDPRAPDSSRGSSRSRRRPPRPRAAPRRVSSRGHALPGAGRARAPARDADRERPPRRVPSRVRAPPHSPRRVEVSAPRRRTAPPPGAHPNPRTLCFSSARGDRIPAAPPPRASRGRAPGARGRPPRRVRDVIDPAPRAFRAPSRAPARAPPPPSKARTVISSHPSLASRR